MARCDGTSSLDCPPGTYFFTLAQTGDQSLATIGSDDTLRLFDASLQPVHAVPKCHTGVTCLTRGGFGSSCVTAGRDGLIRVWDRRAAKGAEIVEPKGSGFASIACHDHYIAAGSESTKEGLGDVSVSLYDVRNPKSPLRRYSESHTDSITQLSFHPDHPHLLLSGSTDGLVSIFDVNHDDEDDALQQVLNPRSAVHCAGFLAPDQVYVVSTDEQYSIYTLAKTAAEDEVVPPPIEFGDVRSTLRCMYVIDVLAQADGGPPLMAFGHNERQTLSIASLGSPGAWAFGQRLDLPGAHGDEVVRGILLLHQRAYTCGEDGNVKAWRLS